MKICIIVPTYNRKNYLRILLNQLKHQKVKGCKIETIVIVDGSTDGTQEMINKEFPHVHKILGTGNWWYTKCMNKGFKYAAKFQPDYVLTLNDDLEIKIDYLLNLIKSISQVEANSLIGSISLTKSTPHRITFSGVKKIIWWRLKEIHYVTKFSLVNIKDLTGIFPSIVLSGRGILIPFNILKRLNFYEEKFVQYSSDTDFTLKAYKSGIKVFISYDAKVYENEKLTSKGAAFNKPVFKEYFLSYFNRFSINSLQKAIRFWLEHGIPVLTPIYLMIMILGFFKLYFFRFNR